MEQQAQIFDQAWEINNTMTGLPSETQIPSDQEAVKQIEIPTVAIVVFMIALASIILTALFFYIRDGKKNRLFINFMSQKTKRQKKQAKLEKVDKDLEV